MTIFKKTEKGVNRDKNMASGGYDVNYDEILLIIVDCDQFQTFYFVGNVPEPLICTICYGVFRDPVELDCQHVFCKVSFHLKEIKINKFNNNNN